MANKTNLISAEFDHIVAEMIPDVPKDRVFLDLHNDYVPSFMSVTLYKEKTGRAQIIDYSGFNKLVFLSKSS